MYVKIVFTMSYEEGHPLYIDAVACFHVTLRKRKLRRYMIERAKNALLYKIDYLFNPEVTNQMEFMGIERINDRIAKKEGLDCPEYPDVRITIIWKHKEDETPKSYNEIERVEK